MIAVNPVASVNGPRVAIKSSNEEIGGQGARQLFTVVRFVPIETLKVLITKVEVFFVLRAGETKTRSSNDE